MCCGSAPFNLPVDFENSAVAIGLGNISFHWNPKECSNYHTSALISQTSKVMLKILQARFQQYVNHELQMFKLVLEKAEEPEINLPTFIGSSNMQESSRKTSTSALLTTPKPLIVRITTNSGKFLKRWEYQTTWPASWEICMQVKKQHSELDMELQTGSSLGKKYVKAVYCHPAYVTSMQSTSWETLELRLPGEISITSVMQMTSTLWKKVKKN